MEDTIATSTVAICNKYLWVFLVGTGALGYDTPGQQGSSHLMFKMYSDGGPYKFLEAKDICEADGGKMPTSEIGGEPFLPGSHFEIHCK